MGMNKENRSNLMSLEARSMTIWTMACKTMNMDKRNLKHEEDHGNKDWQITA